MLRQPLIGLLVALAGASGGGPGLRAQPPHPPVSSAAGHASAAGDPYAPLALYNGNWNMLPAPGAARTTHLANHCALMGAFYICEQVVDDTSKDLVVFVPTGDSAGTHYYRTRGLMADGTDPGGPWGDLAIAGNRWIYSSHDTAGATTARWRTINIFSGPDSIHFEIQTSRDGRTWSTTRQGEERRVRP